MARIGITYDDVQQAAEQLLGEGDIPTHQSVRMRLGKGSFSTIAKHLQAWRAARIEQRTHEAPPPDTVAKAVSHVWEELHQASEARIKQINDDAEIKIAEAHEEARQMIEKAQGDADARVAQALEETETARRQTQMAVNRAQDIVLDRDHWVQRVQAQDEHVTELHADVATWRTRAREEKARREVMARDGVTTKQMLAAVVLQTEARVKLTRQTAHEALMRERRINVAESARAQSAIEQAQRENDRLQQELIRAREDAAREMARMNQRAQDEIAYLREQLSDMASEQERWHEEWARVVAVLAAGTYLQPLLTDPNP